MIDKKRHFNFYQRTCEFGLLSETNCIVIIVDDSSVKPVKQWVFCDIALHGTKTAGKLNWYLISFLYS